MNTDNIGIIFMMWLLIITIFLIGWVKNFIALAEIISDPLTGEAILRIVGVVVVPLGTVLGYFV